MNKKFVLLLAFALLIHFVGAQNSKVLFINTVIYIDGKRDSSFRQHSKPYIEIKLNLYLNDKFAAEVGDGRLANSRGVNLWFANNVDFLNYMEERNYLMIENTKQKYSITYLFKRQ